MAQQDNYIGIAMGLDVTDLKAGLLETQRAIDKANTEFKSATAGMDNWKDTSEGLSAELEYLNTKLKNQKKNVSGYQAEIEELSKTYGENSVQVEELRKKLAKEQDALSKTEKAIREKTSRLNMLEGAYVDTIEDADQLQGSLRQLSGILKDQKKIVSQYEAQLERAKEEHGDTSDEVKELTDKLNRAKSAVEKTENAHKAYSDQLEKVQSETSETTSKTNKMSNSLKDAESSTNDLKEGFTVLKGVMANLIASGINSVISGVQNAITESREFRQEMSYLQATADKTGTSFDHVQEKVKEVYAVLGEQDSAVEGLNNLMTAGFDGAALDQITDQLIGASIQWHDTLKFEGLADGLQETLATGKAIGPFVELLERGGMVAEDFDEGLAKCKTEAEKQNYVLQTLSKLGLSEVTAGYRETNKSLVEGAEAQFEYEKSVSEFGEKAEPIMTTVKQGWIDILNAFLTMFEGTDLTALTSAIEGAFKWCVDDAVPVIKNIIDFIIENKDIILSLVLGVGVGLGAWKIATGFIPAITAVKTAFVGLFTVLSANPIGLVIAAIAALVAAFVYLWNNCDEFREFWINLWDNIKEIAEDVWKAIKEFFAEAWKTIKKTWEGAVKFFTGLWNGIKEAYSSVKTWFTNLFKGAWEGIKGIWNGVVGFFKAIWDGIVAYYSFVIEFYRTIFQGAWNAIKAIWSAVSGWFANIWTNIKSTFNAVSETFRSIFSNAWNNVKNVWSGVKSYFTGIVEDIKGVFNGIKEKFKSIGKDMMNGIKEGITSKLKDVKDAALGVVDGAKDKIKSFLGIESPSRVMRDEVGMMIGEGIAEGISQSEGMVEDEVISLGRTLTDSMPDSAPSFDMSELKNSWVSTMNDIGNDAGISVVDGIILGIESKFGELDSAIDKLNAKLSKINAIDIRIDSAKIKGDKGNNHVVNNSTVYNQTINAPKSPSRIEIYRQTKNLLATKG